MPARPPLFAKALSRPDAVLFDWDDTLAHHRATSIEIIRDVLADMTGNRLSQPQAAEALKVWYDSQEAFCKKYLNDGNHQNTKAHILEVRLRYRDKLDALPIDDTEIFPQTIGVLEALKAKDIPIAIVSNKSQARLEAEIEHHGLTKYFNAIIGYRVGDRPKPDPQPIIRAMRELKLDTSGLLENLWFIGDSPEDSGAARSAGIQRFHVGDFLRDLVHDRVDSNDPVGYIIHLDTIGDLLPYISSTPSKLNSMHYS